MHLDFSADLFWTVLKWLMIAAIWGILAFGIYREDRQIKTMARELATSDIAAFLRMLHQRNIQMWVIITLLVLVGAGGDIRRDMATAQTTALNASAKPASQPQPEVPGKELEPVMPASSGMPFSDIPEFNEKDSKQQAYIDLLKQRYEAWMVTYYYLHKCKQAEPQDLGLIKQALSKELATAGASADVESNIITAANGSYEEIYADIPCDPEHLNASKSSYDANMQQLRGAPTHALTPVSPQGSTKAR